LSVFGDVKGKVLMSTNRVPHASPPTPGGLGSSPTTPLGEDKPSVAASNVGVGISPQATSEAMDMPKGGHHARRSSERSVVVPKWD
jgi:hypothetical protein